MIFCQCGYTRYINLLLNKIWIVITVSWCCVIWPKIMNFLTQYDFAYFVVAIFFCQLTMSGEIKINPSTRTTYFLHRGLSKSEISSFPKLQNHWLRFVFVFLVSYVIYLNSSCKLILSHLHILVALIDHLAIL